MVVSAMQTLGEEDYHMVYDFVLVLYLIFFLFQLDPPTLLWHILPHEGRANSAAQIITLTSTYGKINDIANRGERKNEIGKPFRLGRQATF